MFRRMVFVGAAFAAAVLAQSAVAGDANTIVVRHVEVAYGDLNLGSTDGQAMLRRRIAAAADRACGSNPVFHTDYRVAPNFVRADYNKCRAAAETEAAAALRNKGVRFASAR